MAKKKAFVPTPTIPPETPLTQTTIPAEIRKILSRAGILTIGELAKADTFDWWFLPGMGNKSIAKVEDALGFYGYKEVIKGR